jgi:CrcB protein
LIHILYIGAGGFIGAVSRYLLSKYLNNLLPSFPLGTLAVNITGSFVLGFVIYSVTLGKNISPELRDFVAIGIIGGFTTMSSFAYESFRLLELNQILLLILNVFFNVVMCALFISK